MHIYENIATGQRRRKEESRGVDKDPHLMSVDKDFKGLFVCIKGRWGAQPQGVQGSFKMGKITAYLSSSWKDSTEEETCCPVW